MMEPAPGFEALLNYIQQSTGIDFARYKHPSLLRRLERRLQAVEMPDAVRYGEYLRAHPEEFAPLLGTLLINVTSFFRDTSAWEYLQTVAVPQMLANKPPGEAVRVWSAGCASGREAFSLAIVLAEVMGLDAFRERVKIYGTDLDEEEVEYARRASYTEREMAGVLPELRDKYFVRRGARYHCSKDLRRAAIFARHDLLRDAPISHIDLLCCRNTLMYFNSAGQAKTLASLHFAVNDGGLLFLGKAEMLAAYSSLFRPLDLKQRVFIKVGTPGARARRQGMMEASRKTLPVELPLESNDTMIQNMVFDGGTLAQILIDAAGTVTRINEKARALFNLTLQDVGRPLQDLEVSYRPAELRSLLDQAYTEHRSVWQGAIAWQVPRTDIPLTLDLTVVPLLDSTQQPLGATITFADVTPQKLIQNDLQQTIRELETAYEELQSTNEELETTYEELQSTIEELDTTNNEVNQRGTALDDANAFMASILGSFKAGVAVLNQDFLVLVWNTQMENLWGLRADEVRGSHFWNLDIGLPVERLKQPLRGVLGGQSDSEMLLLPAHNRKGREIECRVSCMPLLGSDGARQGVILTVEEAPALKASADGAHDGAHDGVAPVIAFANPGGSMDGAS